EQRPNLSAQRALCLIGDRTEGRTPMSALQKLKAYFGMMPADELEEYEEDRYGGYGSAYPSDADDYDSYPSRRPLRSPRPVTRLDPADDYAGYEEPRGRRPWTPESTTRATPVTRGALAEQPQV